MIDELREEVKELGSQISTLREQYKAKASELLAKVSVVLVKDLPPEVVTVSWKQRGPDFSDGDYSSASVDTDYTFYDADEEVIEEDVYYSTYSDSELTDSYVKFAKEFGSVVNMIGSEVLLDLFGEDVIVSIDRNGAISTAEYYRW